MINIISFFLLIALFHISMMSTLIQYTTLIPALIISGLCVTVLTTVVSKNLFN